MLALTSSLSDAETNVASDADEMTVKEVSKRSEAKRSEASLEEDEQR